MVAAVPPTGSARASSAPTERRLLLALLAAALLAGGFAVRLAHLDSTPYRPLNDAASYLKLAGQVAATGDYSHSRRPGEGAGGTRGPSAYFPPGFPYYLALVDLLDSHRDRTPAAVHGARVAQVPLGVLTAALVGLIALELLGPLTALLALAIAAFYPVLVELSAIVVAENLFTPLVLGAVWCVLRARRARRPWGWVAGAGVLCGAAWLTHENGILVLLPLALAVWRVSPHRLLAPAVLAACVLLTVLPWTLRNASELHRLIPVSDETGITLVGTYNAASAANPVVPWKWRIFAAIPGERRRTGDTRRMSEPQLDSRLESQALDYVASHPAAPLATAFHNTLRLLELEGTFAWKASAAAQGLSTATARTGVIAFWILAALALAGCLTRRLRRAPGWLWAVPGLLALSVVLVNVETPRFREPVEPFLVLGAACALSWLVELPRRRIRPPAPSAGGRGDPAPTEPSASPA